MDGVRIKSDKLTAPARLYRWQIQSTVNLLQ